MRHVLLDIAASVIYWYYLDANMQAVTMIAMQSNPCILEQK